MTRSTNFKTFAPIITLLVFALFIGLTITGCATADMGYVTYTSADDWAEKTKSGPALPLAKTADVWSDMKTFTTEQGAIGVQSKFLRQNATTCTFEVKFTNNGTKDIDHNVSLTSSQKDKVFAHRFTRVKVPPGKALWYEMEKRECPIKWGESKEMEKCAECSPLLVFLKN